MQDPGSFNLDAVERKIEEVIRDHHGGSCIVPSERPMRGARFSGLSCA
jgi:hypothetical protein